MTLVEQAAPGEAELSMSQQTPSEPELSLAAAVLEATYDNIAAHEKLNEIARSFPGRVAMKPFAPYEHSLPNDMNPISFAADVCKVARHYGAKAEVLDMADAASDDEKTVMAQRNLKQFGRLYANPLLITLDVASSQQEHVDVAQVRRRQALRATIANLVIPSLTVVAV